MILVVGATGYLGGMIARQLLAGGQSVRILVRSASKSESLVEAGAELVVGDLRDRPSLDLACRGIATVLATAFTSTFDYDGKVQASDVEGYGNLIDAARTAGIEHFVFVSALGADPDSTMPYVAAKGQIEARLRTSGMSYTILQPSYFMDFWFMGFVYGPASSGAPVWVLGDGRDPHWPVAARDVAAFAVEAVNRPAARNRVIRIGGPRPLSLRDAVPIAERMLGKPAIVESYTSGPLPPGWSPLALQLMILGSSPAFTVVTTEAAAEFGVRLTSLEELLGVAAQQ